MAGCEPLVRALLLADPIISGQLGGTRIYPLVRPQGTPLPAITYQRISRTRFDPLNGMERVQNARLQLDIWGADYGDVKELAADVLEVLGGYAVTEPGPPPALRAIIALPDERDLLEPDPAPAIFRSSSDWSIWWEE